MEYPPTPQQDPQFMAEAAQAAARINAQARGGNVYGARPEQTLDQTFNEQVYTVPAAEAIGRVTGAAVVEGANAYVDPTQRRELYKQYAFNGNVARQENEQQGAFIRDQQAKKDSDDEELVNA